MIPKEYYNLCHFPYLQDEWCTLLKGHLGKHEHPNKEVRDMSSSYASCGCTSGDGGCSYTGYWHDPCKNYPNCEFGVQEAKSLLKNREYFKPENKEKRERDRAIQKLKEDAKKLGFRIVSRK